MISKVINSYDIHINTQQLRIVEKNELAVNIEGYDNRELLVNEPRGSKYVNLLVYEVAGNMIEVNIESFSSIDNIEILLKGFVSSLIDRYHIIQKSVYQLKCNDKLYELRSEELSAVRLPKVEQKNNAFIVNNSVIRVEETSLDLTIKNIGNIKNAFKEIDDKNYDYLVLKGPDTHVVINQNQIIIGYPVLEVVSVLNNVYKKTKITAFNGLSIDVEEEMHFDYYLISNSQFYIDQTDIYGRGFIVK